MSKLSFCLEAVKLHDDDQAALTDAIEHYTRAGMPTEQAERAAIDDVQADVRAERQDLLTAAEAAAPAPATPEPEAKPPVVEPPAAAVQASAPRDVTPEGFYSQLVTAIDQAPMASMPASQWRQWLDSNAAKLGVKKEEIEWSGILDYLAMRGKDKMSRESVANFVEQHGVQVKEVQLGGEPAAEYYIEELPNRNGKLQEPFLVRRVEDDSLFDAYSSRESAQEFIDGMKRESAAPKFDSPSYRLKGGENYREILLTLPTKVNEREIRHSEAEELSKDEGRFIYMRYRLDDGSLETERVFPTDFDGGLATDASFYEMPGGIDSSSKNSFTAGHWDQPNVIAHTRVSDHTDVDGARVLLLNEIQSDWAQKGRKEGFLVPDTHKAEREAIKAKMNDLVDERSVVRRNDDGSLTSAQQRDRLNEITDEIGTLDDQLRGVASPKGQPRGPFVEDTKSWVALVLKRAITLAAQEGHDKVAIVRGDQAASFFDLDKQVDRISYEPTDKGFYVNVMKDGRNIKNGEFTPSQLEDLVGKDIVARMQKGVGTPEESNPNSPDYEDLKGVRNLTGSDLRLEASGMRGFYDKIVPQVAADVLKKIGGKLTTVKLPQKIEDYERTARYEGPVHTFMDVQRMHLLSEKRGGDVYDNPLTGRREDYPINRVANSQELRVVVQHMREGKSFEQAILDPNISEGAAELFGGKIERFDAGADVSNQVGFDITPAMREKLKTGLPLFSKNRASANEDAQEIAKPVLPYLTKDERTKLRRDTAQKLVDLFKQLPSGDEMAAIAWAGRAKRGWYRNSADALVRTFGNDAPRFAALLAAMSPQTSVETNLRNALKTWANWVAAGRPTERSTIFTIMGASVEGNNLTESVLPAWVNNSVRALTTPNPEHLVLSGPKVSSFMLNLRGVVHEVTNDAWMATFAAVDQKLFAGKLLPNGTDPGKGPGYLAMSARVRQAAKRLTQLAGETWTPAEVQETVWSWTKTLYELQSVEVGARELLDNGDVTPERIAAAPDFNALLQEPRYAEVLRQVHLEPRAGDGRSAGAGTAGSAAEPRAGGQAAPFAASTQSRYERRAADRLERLRDERRRIGEAASGTEPVQLSVGRGVRGSDEPVSLHDRQERDAAPLTGLPQTVQVDGKPIKFGPYVAGREAARSYMEKAGLAYNPPTTYAKVDVARATRIAQAFEDMQHAPQDPQVAAAYAKMIEETVAQYEAMLATGVKVEFIDYAKTGDPYGNPRKAILDVTENNHLWVFPTDDGFGSSKDFKPENNPLLAFTDHEISGKPTRANDLFRAVHDFFGHIKDGVGFRADGEENAWRSHSAMYSPLARRAMTSETRGQNSWLNFGPNGESNRTAKTADTVFADQKIGLLPQWAVDDGAADVKASKARDVTETPEFKRWFGDSKVVDAQGKPLVVYHGTSTGIQEFTLDRAGQNGASSREAGIFFTDEPSLADQYANEAAMRQRLKATDRYWPKNLPPRGDANAAPTVMPVYLSLQNPAKLDMKGKTATPARTAAAIERAKEKGRDGLIIVSVDDATYGERSQHSGSDTIYVAFHPEQIKSAIGNSGAFNDSPNISLARARPSNAPQSWTMPDDTYLDKKLFEWQDSKIDLKRAQEAITANGAAIREQFDTRLAETNYAGRAAFRTETFAASEVQPLLTTMRAGKVSFEEIGDFLLARHAPERNAQIRAINPAIPDGGAGANSQGVVMTDAAARAFLAAIPAARRTVLDTVARRVDAITAGTRNLLVAEGLEKQATMNTWQRLYPNYVPLFKDEAEDSVSHPQGMGFNVRGATSKRATGSTEKVTNVIAHVVQQREAAITRAEKNRVGLSLYGLALTHPNPEFWAVINPGMSATRIRAELQSVGIDPATWANMDPAPTIRSVDPVTNKVVDRTNPMYRNMDSAIVLRVNGEDRVMLFNERNDRALRLAQDMKNMDGLVALNLAATMVGRATRWFAAVNTQYNLAFGLVNFTRDVIAGTVHLTNTDLRYDKAKVLGNLPAALVGIARDVRGDPNRTLWSDLWVRFQDAGGRTGYRELFAGPNSRAAALEKELRSLDRKAPGKAVHAVLDFLDDFNVSMENATRLSAFKAGLDRGLSEAASARIARELTVDFNRKGRTGRALNPIYAFLNASIQGVERTGRAIAGPAGTRIILGGLALGVVQALILAAAGYEPDDLEQYVKARAFIIPTGGDKRYFQIPLPPGLNVIPNTSRVLTELAMTGGRDWKKKLPEALGQIVGALNVFSGESNLLDPSSALRTAMPTVGDMFVDLSTGKNWMGRPIEKAPYTEDDNRPGYQRSREATLRSTTGKGYLAAAQGANWATGGTAYEQGLWSPTPEKLRYLMQQVGGGVARELEKVVDSTVAATGDEQIEPRALPMASRFVGHVDQEHVGSQQFYDAEHRLKRIESSFRAADKAGDAEAVEKMVAKYPTELAALQTLHDVDKQLGALTKEAVETITDRKRLAEIDKERAELMGVFNTTLKQLETDQAKAAATKSGSSR